MARPASRFLRRIVGGVLTDRGIAEVTEEREHTSVSGRAMTALSSIRMLGDMGPLTRQISVSARCGIGPDAADVLCLDRGRSPTPGIPDVIEHVGDLVVVQLPIVGRHTR
jgi:hypothetical protein